MHKIPNPELNDMVDENHAGMNDTFTYTLSAKPRSKLLCTGTIPQFNHSPLMHQCSFLKSSLLMSTLTDRNR